MQTLSEAIRERVQINEIGPLAIAGLVSTAAPLMGPSLGKKAGELITGKKLTKESFSNFSRTRALEIFESLQNLLEFAGVAARIGATVLPKLGGLARAAAPKIRSLGSAAAGQAEKLKKPAIGLGKEIGKNVAVMGGTSTVLSGWDKFRNRNKPSSGGSV